MPPHVKGLGRSVMADECARRADAANADVERLFRVAVGEENDVRLALRIGRGVRLPQQGAPRVGIVRQVEPAVVGRVETRLRREALQNAVLAPFAVAHTPGKRLFVECKSIFQVAHPHLPAREAVGSDVFLCHRQRAVVAAQVVVGRRRVGHIVHPYVHRTPVVSELYFTLFRHGIVPDVGSRHPVGRIVGRGIVGGKGGGIGGSVVSRSRLLRRLHTVVGHLVVQEAEQVPNGDDRIEAHVLVMLPFLADVDIFGRFSDAGAFAALPGVTVTREALVLFACSHFGFS